MKKAVLIGGGVGSSTFTIALKDLPDLGLTTVVSAFDDGGSTGAIRRDYGGIALGDFRQCILASANVGEDWERVLNYRFGAGHLYSINVGNLLIKAFLQQFKNQRQGVCELHRVLGLKNRVLPISYTFARLEAVLANGHVLRDQHEVATYVSFSKAPIKTVRLSRPAALNPDARRAILEADYLIFAPGHFFTSVLPHLYVDGFADAWHKSKARKIWMVNLLAHNGQDSFYSLRQYLAWFQNRLGRRPFDLAILNRKIDRRTLRAVADRFSETKILPEDLDYLKKQGISYETADLVSPVVRKQQPNDTVQRAPLRHDVAKIKKFFTKILHG